MQHIHIQQNSLKLRKQYTKKIYTAISLLIVTLSIGIVGFILIEKYSFIQAVYMTIITISTVGFTEVKPLSEAGRIFTSVLILFNIGIFAYFVSTITTMLMEGELKRMIKNFSVQNKIKNLDGHIIICGFGRLGQQVAEELRLEGQQFVGIERNPDVVESLDDDNDTFLVEGDATDEDLLEKVQIDSAKALITTLPKDADNVFVVLSARQFNSTVNVISRASNESSAKKIMHAGANHVIMPEHLGGTHMAKLVTKPDVVEFLTEISGQTGVNIYFEECSVQSLPDTDLNKTIRQLDVKRKTGANIIGLRRADGSFLINPSADEIISLDSKLIVLGDQSQIESFKQMLNSDES